MKRYILFAVMILAFAGQGCTGCSDNNSGPADNTTGKHTGATGKFLMMSDIHFNPYCDSKILPQLVKADYTDWPTIFSGVTDTSYGYYDSDTYYKLLVSGLEAMQAQNSKPDMIIINGDLLSHHFNSYFYARSGETTAEAYESFVRKTISFVFMMIDKYFPGVPVLPVLGNNDDYCGDYHIQPDGPFLSFYAGQSAPMLRNMQQTDFMTTFKKGGYYKVTMPWDSTQAFIGLNTIFFYEWYSNVCNPTDTANPAIAEMAWLEQQLADCKAKGQHVWLSYHIPPGIDVYKSTQSGPCGVVTMWHEKYNSAFIALVNKYRDVIQGNFAGHTHMDEFRLVADGDDITSFVHITPAVSPIFGNNPAFVEVTWDPAKMLMLNSVTYRFKGIEHRGNNNWVEEYNYGKTYHINSIDAATLGGLWQKMETDTAMHNRYAQYFYVSNPKKQPKPWKFYWCGMRYIDTAGFVQCNCK